MTKMKRVSVIFPDDLDRGILELRKTNEYVRCSYAEIIRQLVRIGLEAKSPKLGDKQEKTPAQ